MTLQQFDIKRGHYKKIDDGKLKELMDQYFEGVEEKGEKLISHYGAMQPITVWIKDKKTLCVEIVTDSGAGDDIALTSIKAKNGFLLNATGFSTKERSKRLQKKAKEGKL